MITTLNTSAHDLRAIPDGSVHAVMTSPPYYGLRSYAGEQDVEWPFVVYRLNEFTEPVAVEPMRCALGLEPSPVAFVGHLILCLREWRRVLRDDGCIFVNLGDSYAGSGGAGGDYSSGGLREGQPKWKSQFKAGDTVKPKDLLGIPWMFAFAARADGWYLRQDVIWAKGVSGTIRSGSVMPESVQDRFCKSHEYVFMLTKSNRYFFDQYAVADIIGNTKSHEYNGKHEHENVQQVWTSQAARPVQQGQAAKGRTEGIVQELSFRYEEGLGSEVQPFGEGQEDGAPLLLFGEGASNKAELSGTVRDNYGTEGQVSRGSEASRERGKVQGAPEEILVQREGESAESAQGCEIPAYREREVFQAQDRDQAQASDQIHGLHLDTEGMGGDQGSVRPQVRLLSSSDATVGNGPRGPVVEGRETHSGERGSSLPDLQRQEGQSNRATRRSVWLISPRPYAKSHYAVWPETLVEPMILASTSARGCCPQCGAGWRRVVERTTMVVRTSEKGTAKHANGLRTSTSGTMIEPPSSTTIGWEPSCDCDAGEPIPCTILDPFAGSGTTGRVAVKHRRAAILCDISGEYLEEHVPDRTTVQMRLGVVT